MQFDLLKNANAPVVGQEFEIPADKPLRRIHAHVEGVGAVAAEISLQAAEAGSGFGQVALIVLSGTGSDDAVGSLVGGYAKMKAVLLSNTGAVSLTLGAD